jgi:peptide/nickel transport system ATP-binding protein
MAFLRVEELVKHFNPGEGALRAVDGVSFEVRQGETVGIVGESGCGKTTLVKTLLRLTPPTSGKVWLDGEDLASLPESKLRAKRRELQIVFQDPFGSLNPRHDVETILTTPLKAHGLGSTAERRQRVLSLLESVGLPRDALPRYPHEFSGGQRQRIGIARALVLSPRLLICDEPVSALDLSIQAQILNLLVDAKARFGLSYLFISHDLSVMRYFADRVLVMYLGKIVETGDHSSLWARPLHPYTRALMQAAPDPTQRRRAPALTGELPSPRDVPKGCAFHPRCPLASDRCRIETPLLRAFGDNQSAACHHPPLDA